ncbi:hypothetical protein BCR42DRAFT_395396 [Absidia repens]|uniref:Uncharacterized protein n=1 Tax=Absidia repens TaxID=90262 RepID=A0A1X2I7T3_9FUNG|nr:hypothetical protein BCR42DRAFT_395396 [Absidia repens]
MLSFDNLVILSYGNVFWSHFLISLHTVQYCAVSSPFPLLRCWFLFWIFHNKNLTFFQKLGVYVVLWIVRVARAYTDQNVILYEPKKNTALERILKYCMNQKTEEYEIVMTFNRTMIFCRSNYTYMIIDGLQNENVPRSRSPPLLSLSPFPPYFLMCSYPFFFPLGIVAFSLMRGGDGWSQLSMRTLA